MVALPRWIQSRTRSDRDERNKRETVRSQEARARLSNAVVREKRKSNLADLQKEKEKREEGADHKAMRSSQGLCLSNKKW